jgi:hypothetical protein
MGPRMHQLLATLCVASSFALFAQGGADPTGRCCLRTLSCCRPMTIVRPILDTVVVFHDVEGLSCKESGWRANSCLLRPFTVSVRACRFASSGVTPWGYKAGDRPYVNLRPLVRPLIASSPPSLRLKRKRDRKVDLETGVVELTGCCFSFSSKPWQSGAGPCQRSRKSTCKTS